MIDYRIRLIKPEDIYEVTEVEAVCFPPEEAASREIFEVRMKTFPQNFWVAEDKERIIGFINGCLTDCQVIEDEMYHDSSCHKTNGLFQSVFGLDVIPECRKYGVGADLMHHLIESARLQGRKGVILTCKKHLLQYYERFGFVNKGVSNSIHGGAIWYDMILIF